MILHENEEQFNDAITDTAEHFQIPEDYVIKDYFLTRALKYLSDSECFDYVVFKGGTSLSKVFKVIHRFSEDIDLVILDPESLSGNQKQKKGKEIIKTASTDLIKDDNFQGTRASLFNKVRYHIPMLGNSDLGEVANTILIECNAFANPVPVDTYSMRSLIADYVLETQPESEKLISQSGLEDFKLKVLKPTRTLTEKVMSLIKFAYKNELSGKSRHLYDITMLLRNDDMKGFLNDDAEFFELLGCVIANDANLEKSGTAPWIDDNPDLSESEFFKDIDASFTLIESEYNGAFDKMITQKDTKPTKDEVIDTLGFVKQRLADYCQSQP
ncbi:nucleotidyl transferase AbiEii/AbiGii toxin family protein [Vibrio europaeus]|uniref:nucleotidyl transferase AbiEii/AbiGii toxin family protein n=1 Tax=Vibrio europaeus TaxID=300876 RepID=UPI0039E01B9D